VSHRQSLKDAMTRAGIPHAVVEDEDTLVTRQHFFDDTLNYVETEYSFTFAGSLTKIEVRQYGCRICCEVGAEVCTDDTALYLDEKEQDRLIEKAKSEL
jgi:hypothetical protein